jgi:hypothetical protein
MHLICLECQVLSTFTSQCKCLHLHSHCLHLTLTPNIPILLTAISQLSHSLTHTHIHTQVVAGTDHQTLPNIVRNTENGECWSSRRCGIFSASAVITNFSIIRPTRCTNCFQFITINSLYMFRARICSSSGCTVHTTVGIFCVCIMLVGC